MELWFSLCGFMDASCGREFSNIKRFVKMVFRKLSFDWALSFKPCGFILSSLKVSSVRHFYNVIVSLKFALYLCELNRDCGWCMYVYLNVDAVHIQGRLCSFVQRDLVYAVDLCTCRSEWPLLKKKKIDCFRLKNAPGAWQIRKNFS